MLLELVCLEIELRLKGHRAANLGHRH